MRHSSLFHKAVLRNCRIDWSGFKLIHKSQVKATSSCSCTLSEMNPAAQNLKRRAADLSWAEVNCDIFVV